MKKMVLAGLALTLTAGVVFAANGDGTRSAPAGGRGYGFVDANNDGINDNFVDVNGDGIDDNWVDADKDGVNDLRGTKSGTGRGRVSQDPNSGSEGAAQPQSQSRENQGRRGRR